MRHIKSGVSLDMCDIHLIEAIIAASVVYTTMDYEFVITSLGDGIHGKNSLHYVGRAFDARTRHVKRGDLPELVRTISANLGADYDVVLEDDHLHVEYDPKS